MANNKKGTVRHGTTLHWDRTGEGFEAVGPGGLRLAVERCMVAGLIRYVAKVHSADEVLATGDDFHSPTLAMREAELLAKDYER